MVGFGRRGRHTENLVEPLREARAKPESCDYVPKLLPKPGIQTFAPCALLPHTCAMPGMHPLLARAATHPGLHLGGNGYIGTGIPDAIRQGEEIAARIMPPSPAE